MLRVLFLCLLVLVCAVPPTHKRTCYVNLHLGFIGVEGEEADTYKVECERCYGSRIEDLKDMCNKIAPDGEGEKKWTIPLLKTVSPKAYKGSKTYVSCTLTLLIGGDKTPRALGFTEFNPKDWDSKPGVAKYVSKKLSRAGYAAQVKMTWEKKCVSIDGEKIEDSLKNPFK